MLNFQQNAVSAVPSTVVTADQKVTPSVTNYYPPKSSIHSSNGSYRGVMRESSYQNPGPHGNLCFYIRFFIIILVCSNIV